MAEFCSTAPTLTLSWALLMISQPVLEAASRMTYGLVCTVISRASACGFSSGVNSNKQGGYRHVMNRKQQQQQQPVLHKQPGVMQLNSARKVFRPSGLSVLHFMLLLTKSGLTAKFQ